MKKKLLALQLSIQNHSNDRHDVFAQRYKNIPEIVSNIWHTKV